MASFSRPQVIVFRNNNVSAAVDQLYDNCVVEIATDPGSLDPPVPGGSNFASRFAYVCSECLKHRVILADTEHMKRSPDTLDGETQEEQIWAFYVDVFRQLMRASTTITPGVELKPLHFEFSPPLTRLLLASLPHNATVAIRAAAEKTTFEINPDALLGLNKVVRVILDSIAMPCDGTAIATGALVLRNVRLPACRFTVRAPDVEFQCTSFEIDSNDRLKRTETETETETERRSGFVVVDPTTKKLVFSHCNGPANRAWVTFGAPPPQRIAFYKCKNVATVPTWVPKGTSAIVTEHREDVTDVSHALMQHVQAETTPSQTTSIALDGESQKRSQGTVHPTTSSGLPRGTPTADDRARHPPPAAHPPPPAADHHASHPPPAAHHHASHPPPTAAHRTISPPTHSFAFPSATHRPHHQQGHDVAPHASSEHSKSHASPPEPSKPHASDPSQNAEIVLR
jgi:hypothetical protein